MTDEFGPHHVDHLMTLGKWTRITKDMITDKTYEEFCSNLLLQLAVSKAVEMVGEISGRLIKRWPDWCAEHPELELANAYAMRNRMAHGYETVDLATVWRTISSSVPDMDRLVQQLLKELDAGDP